MRQETEQGSNKMLYRYIGLTTQILVAIGVGVFIGYRVDKWLSFSIPLLVWVLPLVIIVLIVWQIIKDTSKK